MSIVSNNGIVLLPRGDSFSLPLFINSGTKLRPVRYEISKHPDTVVYFGVMEPNQPFEEALLRKRFTHASKLTPQGDLLIELTPTETEMLLPGKYYYQVKVKFGNDSVDTIIPKTLFYVCD